MVSAAPNHSAFIAAKLTIPWYQSRTARQKTVSASRIGCSFLGQREGSGARVERQSEAQPVRRLEDTLRDHRLDQEAVDRGAAPVVAAHIGQGERVLA